MPSSTPLDWLPAARSVAGTETRRSRRQGKDGEHGWERRHSNDGNPQPAHGTLSVSFYQPCTALSMAGIPHLQASPVRR